MGISHKYGKGYLQYVLCWKKGLIEALDKRKFTSNGLISIKSAYEVASEFVQPDDHEA